jgi:cytochrome c oxidase cbb3-type subunit 3
MNRQYVGLIVWAALLGQPALGDAGKDVFSKNCIPCHGQDGKAHTPAGRMLRAKDLTQSKLADAEIRKQVTEGYKDQRGPVMPAFKDTLSPDQIEAVVAFVKSLRN